MHNPQANRRQLISGGAGLMAINALPAFARVAQPEKTVQAMLDAYVADDRLPGAVGAVGRGIEDPLFFAAGTIARKSERKMDADSLFRIYSMTKPVTGMAAMMLIEDGKIGLDQNIADFIPGFANPMVLIDPKKDLAARPAKSPVTVRNLLTHTAGLGYLIVTPKGPLYDAYVKAEINSGQISRKRIPGFDRIPAAPSLAIFADRLARLPLIADPGTRWSYSVALDLMGRIIELASGMAFDAFLKTRIFDPLGMTSTYFQVPVAQQPRLTTNYGITPFGKFPLDPGPDSIYLDKPAFPFGGSGLVSSARDYDRFLLMLAGYGAVGRTRIMQSATARLAMSNLMPPGADTKGTFVDGQGFGAGGRITTNATDRFGVSVGTFGWAGAAATVAWVDPTRGVRASGYAQYMPDQSMPFTADFRKSVYAGL